MERRAWLWLQDGVVIKDKLYFPDDYCSDLNQRGLQFAVKDVVVNEILLKRKDSFMRNKQKLAPLLSDTMIINTCLWCNYE